MIHLDQELAKVKGTILFSTMDMANGFRTMKVDPADQYKAGFLLRQPSVYMEPLPIQIFKLTSRVQHLPPQSHVACGNLIYVDDILMRNRTFEEHLAEI